MNKDLNLKPCPFCGSSRVVYRNYDEYDGQYMQSHEIACLHCGARLNGKHKSDAINKWNTRKEGEK